MSFHDFIERAWAYGVRPSSRRKITAQQMYPWAVERQLQADLKAEFVKAGMYYKEQALKGTQSFKDNADDLADAEYDNDDRIQPLAERVAYEVEKFQQACFENFSDVVIGERYVPAVVGPSITDTWQENFLTLCRSANDDLKRKVSAIISDAVMNGNNIADTARQIDEAVGHYSYSKAMTIARTETGKLNMAISKAQMEEAGIDKYEWSCMMDERSRPSHEKMDGKICIWSNPNVVYNIKTKKTEPRPQSAVHLHPGDDYNCRCVALPWDELIEEELNKKKGKPNKQWLELKEQEKQKAAQKSFERIRVKNIPFIGDKLSSLISSQNSTLDFIAASSRKNSDLPYSNVLSTPDNESANMKLSAAYSDIKDVLDRNKYYNKNYGKLVFLVDDSLPKGVLAQSFFDNRIKFTSKTSNELFRALKKIAQKKADELSIKEADSILTLWHELNHLMDKVKTTGAVFTEKQRLFLETVTEFISRHTIDDFLRDIGGLTEQSSTLMHSEKLLAPCYYDPFVKKLEILVNQYGINPHNFATLLRSSIDSLDPNSRDLAIKEVFDLATTKPYLGTNLNDLIDKIVDESTSVTDYYNLVIR